MNLNEFNNSYFYKTDLQKICQKHHLPTYGTKSELEMYIKKYLSGVPVSKIYPIRTKTKNQVSLKHNQISPDTKLLNSGFSLNNEARQFFADYFNVSEFHFKKTMAVKLRECEKNNDTNATVMDLINALKHKITKSNAEVATYQWNNFVKDFCASPKSKMFTHKLSVAAILWKYVKSNPGLKHYDDKLIKLNFEKVQSFIKK